MLIDGPVLDMIGLGMIHKPRHAEDSIKGNAAGVLNAKHKLTFALFHR